MSGRRSWQPFPQEIPGQQGAGGGGAAGTPAFDPAWYAYTDIWLDPVNGSDTNVGGSMGARVPALKTVNEIVQRYGSWQPQCYTHPLTIHQLSAQPFGSDLFVFDPIMGACNFVWDGLSYAPAVGGPFSPTSVTTLSQANPGSDWILNGNLPTGAAAGLIVWNKTKSSYSMIDTISGSSAILQQPILLTPPPQAYPTFVEDTTWSHFDTYQLLQPLGVNWLNQSISGGQLNGINPPIAGTAWIQGIKFYDQSGTPGFSQISIHPVGILHTLWLCAADPLLILNGYDSSDLVAIACFLNGGCELSTNSLLCACSSNASGNANTILIGGNMQMNTILHGITAISPGWENSFIECHVLGNMIIEAGATAEAEPGAVLWGAGSINVRGPGALVTAPQTFANTLKVATLQLDGQATGSSFNGTSYTAGVTITSSNLDTGGGAGQPGLSNPRTGARFAST